jgi:hypothetical protein
VGSIWKRSGNKLGFAAPRLCHRHAGQKVESGRGLLQAKARAHRGRRRGVP